MSEDVLKRIYRLLEIQIGHNPTTLHRDIGVRALKERMSATRCEDPSNYYEFLITHPDELQQFIELIVVPETWFFRDLPSLEFTVNYCIEKWISQKFPVRILCAPCSTGEEAYSLAMLFHEKNIPSTAFKIDAVDISKNALLDASLAIYGKNSFRTKDLEFRNTYFMEVDDGYLLHPNMRKSVDLIHANLCNPEFYENRLPYHVILCRNLLIYLQPQAQKALLHLFRKVMHKHSVLILSPSESEVARKEGFVPIDQRRYCAFLRPGSPKNGNFHEEGERSKEELKLPAQEASVVRRDRKVLLQEAQKMADHGEFSHSLDKCYEILEEIGPDIEVFFLIGVIQQATGNDAEAGEYFKKTIEFDPHHAKALVYLSLLADTKGDREAAAAYMQRAKKSPSSKRD